MKLNNRVLVECIGTLRKLNQSELPVTVAFIIMKNTKEIEKEVSNYYAAREKLVQQYAILDETGNAVPDEYGRLQFKEGCVEKWNADIDELLEIDVKAKIQVISMHDLVKSELAITPSELSVIEFMIED